LDERVVLLLVATVWVVILAAVALPPVLVGVLVLHDRLALRRLAQRAPRLGPGHGAAPTISDRKASDAGSPCSTQFSPPSS